MSEADVKSLVGLSIKEAETTVHEAGFNFRISCQDGVPIPVTADYRRDRVDVTTFAGKVTHAEIG